MLSRAHTQHCWKNIGCVKGMCNWGGKNTKYGLNAQRLTVWSVVHTGQNRPSQTPLVGSLGGGGSLATSGIFLTGPVIPLLGICPKYALAKIENHVCVWFFIVAFF